MYIRAFPATQRWRYERKVASCGRVN